MPTFRPTEPPDGDFQSATRRHSTRIRYRPLLTALFRPGHARQFFTHLPESREALAAELARLSYVSFARHGDLVQGHLSAVGLRLMNPLYDDGNTQAFFAEGHDLRVLAFRGSDDTRAWRTNLRGHPARWPGPGKVHRGFYRAFAIAWPKLEKIATMRDRRPLLVAGHSMGGAMAFLTGMLVPNSIVYSFGSPRVGNKAFAAAVEESGAERFHRYTNYRDPVCRVPFRLMGYRDCGTGYYIDKLGRVGPPPLEPPRSNWRELEDLLDGLENLLKNPRARRNDFTDHAPINYVSALR